MDSEHFEKMAHEALQRVAGNPHVAEIYFRQELDEIEKVANPRLATNLARKAFSVGYRRGGAATGAQFAGRAFRTGLRGPPAKMVRRVTPAARRAERLRAVQGRPTPPAGQVEQLFGINPKQGVSQFKGQWWGDLNQGQRQRLQVAGAGASFAGGMGAGSLVGGKRD